MVDGKLVIAIDFDGTITTESFPQVGQLMVGADAVIRRLFADGHKIIINTCRSGKYEGWAEDFLKENLIPYHLINSNLPELIDLYKQDCRKISADIYIDNTCLFPLPSRDVIYDIVNDKYICILEEQREERMKVIGQNGNTGEHYDERNN